MLKYYIENLPCLFAVKCIARHLGLPFQGQGGIESLHDNFHDLYFVGLSERSIVKKTVEFAFVVDGVASGFKFLAVIESLQEARPLPIGNIVIFSRRNWQRT